MSTIESSLCCQVCFSHPESNIAEKKDENIKKIENIMKCAKCHVSTYCSTVCQRKDWSTHKVICPTLQELEKTLTKEASVWRGNRLIALDSPTSSIASPCSRPEWWGRFATFMISEGLLAVNLEFLPENKEQTKIALDLGCGNSDSPIELLQKGWKVIGEDYSQESVKALVQRINRINQKWLENKQITFEYTPLESYKMPSNIDLVVAGSILPYSNPKKIHSILLSILTALKPGGVFMGNFFAKKYARPNMHDVHLEMGNWFLKDEDQVNALLVGHGFKVLKCEYGGKKNHDSVVFVAQKIEK